MVKTQTIAIMMPVMDIVLTSIPLPVM